MSEADDNQRSLSDRLVNGESLFSPSLTPEGRDGPVCLFCDNRRVVPVLFIPGIMATRLKVKKGSQAAWDPPDESKLSEAIPALFAALMESTKDRAEKLTPENVEVDYSIKDSVLEGKDGAQKESLAARGWGSIYGSAYHGLMEYIEKNLNWCALDPVKKTWTVPPDEWCDTNQSAPIDEAAFKKAAAYRYEVWGGGYNFLQSNEKSAADLMRYVQETVIPHYDEKALNPEKKILVVTHSMGGLVARSLNLIYAAQILGVVHVAQPASGAPATYKRMRAGFEGIAKYLLGKNAESVTSLMGAAQGALELLPFADYNKGKPWLFTTEGAGADKKRHGLPRGGDPYGDIYTNAMWYGLVPDYNTYMLGLGKTPDEEPAPDKGNADAAAAARLMELRSSFFDMIENVQGFHQSIMGKYHPHTFALWGDAGGAFKAWGSITWMSTRMTVRERPSWMPPRKERGVIDSGTGAVWTDGCRMNMKGPEMPGDGTVPNVSAEAQQGCLGYFINGDNPQNPNLSRKKADKGYEHSACCNDERVKRSVVYCLFRHLARMP